MRAFLLFAFILGFGLNGQAQINRFSIGVGGSVDKTVDGTFETPWPAFESTYEDLLGYSVGLQVNYEINHRLGLRSGVSYSVQGYNVKYGWIGYGDGNAYGDPLIPLQTAYTLSYLNIPIEAYFIILKTKPYSLAPAIGLMNSINIGQCEVSKMDDGNTRDTNYNKSEPNPYMMGARLGLINNFNLGKKIFISLEPYCMYNFTEAYTTDTDKADFIYGGYLSVNYRFGNKDVLGEKE